MSLVELVFEAIGIEEAAAGVYSLAGSIRQLSGLQEETAGMKAFGGSVENLTASIRDHLSPVIEGQMSQFLAMGAAALTVRAAYEGFTGSIGDGANYVRVSQRIGENIRDTVVLSQAYKNAGLNEEYIARSANLLEKALGGVNETGGSTVAAFGRLHLTIAQLKSLSFYEQLQLLSKGFETVTNQSERANIAMQIFGGRNGGQMLQMLGDPDALSRAEDQAGRLADKYQADAGQLLAVQQAMNGVNARLREMWLAAAEQVIPSIEKLSGLLSGMNLSAMGSVLGAAGPTALGGMAAFVVTDKLDMKLLDIADRFGGSLTGQIAGAAAQATGLLAAAMPVGLAAAIAAQIVLGLVTAFQDSQIQDILHQERSVHREVDPYRKGADQAVTADEWNANKSAAEAHLDDMQTEERGLRGKRSGNANARLAELQEAIPKIEADIRNIYASAGAMAEHLARNQAAAAEAAMEPLVAQLPKLREEAQKDNLQDLDPAHKAMALDGQLTSLQRQQQDGAPKGLSADATEAYQLDLAHKIAEVKKQIAEVNAKMLEQATHITEEEKKQAEANGKREIYALETQQEAARASGNKELAESLREQISLKQAALTLSGDDLKLAQDRDAAEHASWVTAQGKETAKESAQAQKDAIQAQLESMRANLSAIEANADLSVTQKWTAKKEALNDELASLQKIYDLEMSLAKQERLAGHGVVANQHETAANDVGKDIAGVRGETRSLGPDPSSFSASWAVALDKLRDNWTLTMKTMADGIASVAEGMEGGMAHGIQGILNHTETLKQAWFSTMRGMYSSLDSEVSQMVAKWIMQNVVMATYDKAFAAQSVATKQIETSAKVGLHAGGETAMTASSAGGSAARSGISLVETVVHGIHVAIRTAVHIAGEATKTAATLLGAGIRITSVIVESLANVIQAAAGAMSAMASIPYVGPFLALGAAVAIFAAGESLVRGIGKGFESGGYTGGREGETAGIVHGQEYVFSAPAVRAIGVDNLGAIHRQALSGGARGALSAGAGGGGGGGSAGAGSRESPRNYHFYLDRKAFATAMQEDMSGHFIDLMDQHLRSA